MADHTVKAYDRELDALNAGIVEMGGLVEAMVADATDSLIDGDLERAGRVATAAYNFIDMQHRVEAATALTIAKRAPVAVDLREVVAAIRTAGDLGRVADHAGAIARQTVRLGPAARAPRAVVGLRHMRTLALELLHNALAAYVDRDAARARAVWERDAELDSLEGSLFRDLLAHMLEDPRSITFSAHVMTVSKNIERVGDYATNIAETVIYLVTGAAPSDERPRGRGGAVVDPVVDDE